MQLLYKVEMLISVVISEWITVYFLKICVQIH